MGTGRIRSRNDRRLGLGLTGTGGRRKGAYAGAGWLSATAIRRPVFTSMMMTALVVLGLFSFRRLPIDHLPDVDVPMVAVQVVYPGAGPEMIEKEVTEPLEKAFNPVEGVRTVRSTTMEGVVHIVVEFGLGRQVDQAAQDLRDRVESIRRELPAGIEAPVVQRFDPTAMPVLSVGLFSRTRSAAELTDLAEEVIKRRLESVSGVGEVTVVGGETQEIRVHLDVDRMQARGVSPAEIVGALRRQNLDVPAGRLERDNVEHLVRVAGRMDSPEQVEAVVVANRRGRLVRLRDVARVEPGPEEVRSLALVSGERAVALDLVKVSGANTVEVADRVGRAVAALSADLPADTELRTIRDNSVFIRRSVHDVLIELMIGAFLTVAVVLLFLNDRKATAITSLALPISVISAFIVMGALSFTLNIVTLLGLSLSIGILIDDAIVVIESIVRHRQAGRDRFAAAEMGTREIVLAVTASTLTIVAVFVPVAFMGGIVGRYLYEFGMVVAWALLASLFVSFTLTPMLAAHWGVEPMGGGDTTGWMSRLIGRFNRWFDRVAEGYRVVIAWALDRRKITLGIATATLGVAALLYVQVGGSLLPPSDESRLTIEFETPQGSSLAYTLSKAVQMEEELANLPEVDFTYMAIGAGPTGAVNQGEVHVSLVPPGKRNRSQEAMAPVIREAVGAVFGVKAHVFSGMGVGEWRTPLLVEIRGENLEELRRLSDAVEHRLATVAGVVDVRASMGQARPEWRVELIREKANELGLDVAQVAATLRPLLVGEEATTWEDVGGEERSVYVQVSPAGRVSVEDLATLPIAAPLRGEGGEAVMVPLGQIARFVEGGAPARIDRKNLQRVATVGAGTEWGVSVAEASSSLRRGLSDLPLPVGYSVTLGAETELLKETMRYVTEALLLAVILIFLILASQFESVTHPLAILFSLPLALIGVMVALWITGDTLNMLSMIGVILLMGVVTKNAILLVDRANQERARGADRRTALIEAGRVRLRPILMTSLATIAGMLPVALALGEGGGFRAPMARAVIGGMISSTLLTLVVVPVAYTYVDGLGAWIRGHFGRRRGVPEVSAQG